MLKALAIANYRSLRDVVIPLTQLNVITGANGSGKSSLYRALRLLSDIAQGHIIASLAREGGVQSTLWAGPEQFSRAILSGEHPIQGTMRKAAVNLKLGFASDDFSYAIDLGLPPSLLYESGKPSLFNFDPEIKRECVWHGAIFGASALLIDRKNTCIQVRNKRNSWTAIPQPIQAFDSILTAPFLDPHTVPEVWSLRQQIASWRFYDNFRSDSQAPARLPQIGTRTFVLNHDGADLAAALQTIIENGDVETLHQIIADAFPGATISVKNNDGYIELEMHQYGLLRPMKAAELSDGTLRYLLLVAALLTPRPPALMVLNEPEASLHPDLLPALGRLIAHTAKYSQILLVSHAPRLIAALEEVAGSQIIVLEKHLGETQYTYRGECDCPRWVWPKRS